ncbi:NAD(P)-binding protein [Hypoxylon crocopeplum]|nr:NAD(P)-binding protein [Hypoxylon crocopeplum]
MATVQRSIEDTFNFTKTLHHDTYEFISPKRVDVYGKSVFITGASKGIGRETALSFAKAGCDKIAIGARSDLSSVVGDIKEAARKAGHTREPKVLSFKLDVTDENSIKAAAETISKEFGGKLDVMVNNAGYLHDWRPLCDALTSTWWAHYEVNVKGVFLCSKYFVPLLLESEFKTLVITSSMGAAVVIPGASSYQSSKLAAVRIAEFIATEYEDKGIICFAIHPGAVKTELANNMPEHQHKILVDEPRMPADSTLWLTSERRPWLNGRFIVTNWDMEELEARKDEIVKKDLLKFRLTTAFEG